MKKTNHLFQTVFSYFAHFLLLICFFIYSGPAFAKRPPEIRNQEDLNLSQDMHAQDLKGLEFVKFDLKGFNFSESNLNGTVFNNSNLNKSDFHGANMQDALAYASNFNEANLSEVNLTNALLMESTFENANIDGADFTDAVISRIQQKQLCSIAKGVNTSSGVDTRYSLGC